MKNTYLKTFKIFRFFVCVFNISFLIFNFFKGFHLGGEDSKMRPPQLLNYSFLLYTLYFILYTFIASPVFADQDLGDITGFEKGFFPNLSIGIAEEGGAGRVLERVFSNLLGVFTLAGGLMLIVYFVLGALGWVSAGGDAERLQKAQNQMTNAIIGLILVVAAYGVFYVVGLVVGFNILRPAEELLKLKP